MKVSQLIEDLQKRDPQEELIVAYWDKFDMSEMHDLLITPEVWSETVRSYEDGEFGWQGYADECIVELIEEASA